MKLNEFNDLPPGEAADILTRCCGAQRWVDEIARRRPFETEEELYSAAESIWWELDAEDLLEAFTHHPKIGDLESLREKFASTRDWAEGEQSGTAAASEEVLEALAAANDRYEEKFGYIFIVCATGKSAAEMLAILEDRLPNDPEEELPVAAGEQMKITHIRLQKLLT